MNGSVENQALAWESKSFQSFETASGFPASHFTTSLEYFGRQVGKTSQLIPVTYYFLFLFMSFILSYVSFVPCSPCIPVYAHAIRLGSLQEACVHLPERPGQLPESCGQLRKGPGRVRERRGHVP